VKCIISYHIILQMSNFLGNNFSEGEWDQILYKLKSILSQRYVNLIVNIIEQYLPFIKSLDEWEENDGMICFDVCFKEGWFGFQKSTPIGFFYSEKNHIIFDKNYISPVDHPVLSGKYRRVWDDRLSPFLFHMEMFAKCVEMYHVLDNVREPLGPQIKPLYDQYSTLVNEWKAQITLTEHSSSSSGK